MSVVTAVPWHVYLTMFFFALTIGVLTVVELKDLRVGESRHEGDDARTRRAR